MVVSYDEFIVPPLYVKSSDVGFEAVVPVKGPASHRFGSTVIVELVVS